MKMPLDELCAYHAAMKRRIYNSYMQSSTPWGQSGFSGPEERWCACRRPVADCLTQSGRFLDIGCANGYLLECVLKWTRERRLTIVPYGIDIVDDLVRMAKKRLARYAQNIELADAFRWKPATRFDYVRTEFLYVPPGYEGPFVDRILSEFLTDGGSLLIAEYRSTGNPEAPWLSDLLKEMGFVVSEAKSGFWEGQELTRVSVLPRDDQ